MNKNEKKLRISLLNWWKKLVVPAKGTDDAKDMADETVMGASEFRLENLEPRLLLSADPISAELARVVQEDAQANDADAVAAIVQQIDLAAETAAIDAADNRTNPCSENTSLIWYMLRKS